MQLDSGLSEALVRERRERDERNELVPAAEAGRRTRIVCLGGGTGLPTVLKGLVRKADPRPGDPGLELTAVVAMSDDGGSSGRLRRSRDMVPPGDVRNCLVALAGGDEALTEIFQFRFGGKKGLAGHAVGNLLLAALTELKGDFLEAVRSCERLLSAKGSVLPSTLSPVQLVARLDDDSIVTGERNVGRSHGRVKRVALAPRLPPPSPGIVEAIHQADLITIGPGSLYTSVMPNLLVDGVARALRESRGLKVLISNLMTQPGETDGMSCEDHVRAVLDHAGAVIDVVLFNGAPPSAEGCQRYATKGSVPVSADRKALLCLGVIPVEADLLKESAIGKVRHDSRKVARCLVKLARQGI